MAEYIIPVAAASCAVFIFGMFWYSPSICGNTWMKLQFPGKSMKEIKESSSMLTFPLTLLAQALALGLMCHLMSWCGVVQAGVQTVLAFALCVGTIVALVEIPHTVFSKKPIGLYFIDQLHNIGLLVLGSVVISLVI